MIKITIHAVINSLVLLAVAPAANAAPSDGTVVARAWINLPVTTPLTHFGAKDPTYAAAVLALRMQSITYLSDGLKVRGIIASPAGPGPFPAIIFNRGGNRELGALTPDSFAQFTAMFVQAGYVVVGSNYRGNGGGEGHEEFGGADVDDVMALIPLLRHERQVDATRIGMYGSSRGGLMTYEALARTTTLKAAVVESGLSDSVAIVHDRPNMEANVYSQLIPGYAIHRDASLNARSPVQWADRLPLTTPILLLHGTADRRVDPHDALAMSRALLDAKIPFRLVMFEGGTHGNNEFAGEQQQMEIAWFNRYLRDGAPLPNVVPHGN